MRGISPPGPTLAGSLFPPNARAEAVPEIDNASFVICCAAIAKNLETASVVCLHKSQPAGADRGARRAGDIQTFRIWIAILFAATIGLCLGELIVRAIEGFPAEIAVADRLEAHVRGRAASWRRAIEYLLASACTLVAGSGMTCVPRHAATSLDSAIRGGIRAGAVCIANIACARIAVIAIGIVLLASAVDAVQTAVDSASAIRVRIGTNVIDTVLAPWAIRLDAACSRWNADVVWTTFRSIAFAAG